MTPSLEQLQRMHEAGTPGPWAIERDAARVYVVHNTSPNTLIPVAHSLSLQQEENAALIVAMHAALPKLIACVEEAAFLAERLDSFENDGDVRTDDGERDWHGHVSPSLSRLRAALSSLKEAGE